MFIFLIPCMTSFIVTFFIIPKIISFSDSGRLVARPGDRHSHVGKVPILGGVGIYAGVLFSLLIWGFFYEEISFIEYTSKFNSLPSILIALSIVFCIGLIDDLLSLSPLKKLLGQIASILCIMFLGNMTIGNMQGVFGIFEIPYFASILFTAFVVVVITNSYNLIDGIDGLAGGIGLISSSIFGVMFILNNDIGFAVLSFSLSGSLLGFLRYNFHPARIFMGDTGSLVVGLILSVLAIRLINTGCYIPLEEHFYKIKGPFISIVILAVPLFDTFRVFCIRSLAGYNPLKADRNHIHHALLDLGYGHKKSSIILYFFSILIFCFSYFLINLKQSLAIFILAVVVLIFMAFPFILLHRRDSE